MLARLGRQSRADMRPFSKAFYYATGATIREAPPSVMHMCRPLRADATQLRTTRQRDKTESWFQSRRSARAAP